MPPSARNLWGKTVPKVISRFDVAIIGAGTTGLVAYRKAKAAGLAGQPGTAPRTARHCLHRSADRHLRGRIPIAETRQLRGRPGEFRRPGPRPHPAQNKGLPNVYGDLVTGRLLGAEMLAPAAAHLAHLLAWALQNRMTLAQMLEMPFYHPVVEEGLRTALHDLAAWLRAARADVSKAA